MSETPKMVTERRAVERERIAFRWGWNKRDDVSATGHRHQQERERQMVERYPLPKVTRPRVRDHEGDGLRFRLSADRALEWAHAGRNDWTKCDLSLSFALRCYGDILADLLANPTEEVEDTGDTDTARAA